MKHAIFKQIQDVIDKGVKKGKISDRIILQISFAMNETDVNVRKRELRKLIDGFKTDQVRLLNSVEHKKHFERIEIQS